MLCGRWLESGRESGGADRDSGLIFEIASLGVFKIYISTMNDFSQQQEQCEVDDACLYSIVMSLQLVESRFAIRS
jgi:hypothetical protein